MKFKIPGRHVQVKLSSDGKYLAGMAKQLWYIAHDTFHPYFSHSENGFIHIRVGPFVVMSWLLRHLTADVLVPQPEGDESP